MYNAVENAKSCLAPDYPWLMGGPPQFWVVYQSIICSDHEQSGTKPNLVAKILATKIGNLWA